MPRTGLDEHASCSTPTVPPSRTNTRRWTRFAQLTGSFLLGAILSASLCFYLFYREARIAEQKLGAQLTQRIALPGLPGALPSLVPGSTNANPTSNAGAYPAPASGATPLSLEHKHVTEKDGPCALFTKEELSQILESNLTEVTSDSTGCDYKGSGRGNWVRYEITWKGGREALDQRRTAYETLKKRLAPKDMPLQYAPNLGDEAYMTLTGILQVRKGDRAVLFNLMWFQNLPQERTEFLVDTAFARLE